jgi:hypothetical protein
MRGSCKGFGGAYLVASEALRIAAMAADSCLRSVPALRLEKSPRQRSIKRPPADQPRYGKR